MSKAEADAAVEVVLNVWTIRYDLSDAERDLLDLATRTESTHASLAVIRKTETDTVKKQVYSLNRKVGTRSLAGAAILVLRQALGDMTARPHRPSRPLPVKGRR